MDPSDRAWRRPALAALAVAALLAVVALAAHGRPWAGGGSRTHDVPRGFWDAVWTVVFLLWLVAAAFALRRTAIVRRQTGPASWKDQLRTLLIVVLSGFLLSLVFLGRRFRHHPTGHGQAKLPEAGQPAHGTVHHRTSAYEPHFNLPVAIAVLALLAIAAAVFIVRRGTRQAVQNRQSAALALADDLDESLDDLRSEPDPRRAVIAAYARMERTLARHELGREPSEAPGEYLARVLGGLGASGESAGRLTGLFERAKFSPHEIDEPMRDDAIAALEALRDELRAAG